MDATELNPPLLACHTNWTLKTALSEVEIQKEKRYLITERLGILCGTGEPDIDALAHAVTEADEWEARYNDSI
jgi:hypothetical protein